MYTVKPVLNTSVLSGQPALSGTFSKSTNYFPFISVIYTLLSSHLYKAVVVTLY